MYVHLYMAYTTWLATVFIPFGYMIMAIGTVRFRWFLFTFENKSFINSKMCQHDIGVVFAVCCTVISVQLKALFAVYSRI